MPSRPMKGSRRLTWELPGLFMPGCVFLVLQWSEVFLDVETMLSDVHLNANSSHLLPPT